MKGKGKTSKSKLSQSIIEYVCVSIVFATVGIGTFMAAHETATNARQGTKQSFNQLDTEMGKILNHENSKKGITPDQYVYPSTWGKQADKAVQGIRQAPNLVEMEKSAYQRD